MTTTIAVAVLLYLVVGMILATAALAHGEEIKNDRLESLVTLICIALWPLVLVLAIPAGIAKVIRARIERCKPAGWTEEFDARSER